ncbi:MAG: hypothetical protein N2320_02405 [Candidatus Bipolaricaulota bacterium]|nr:hypothetical protein [Candidatus Bipolaricaulota bacterium]
MYTVPELVNLLGLSTENQVRNRIEAIRDLLLPAIRRGPNNQLLLTEDGLALLRDLQTLCESGHTLTEAANVLRYKIERDEKKAIGESPTITHMSTKQDETESGWRALVEHLAAEVRELSARVAALEAALRREPAPWWERWR